MSLIPLPRRPARLNTPRGVLLGFVFGLGAVSALQAQATPVAAHAAVLQACPTVKEDIVDLNMLADGLKDSSAVGLLEKLRLKLAIDQLVDRFKALHRDDKRYTLDQLQEQYDLLMMRIAQALQDKDPALHGRLCSAWAPIWATLQDRSRFQEQFT